MSSYSIDLVWKNSDADFAFDSYSRDHKITFSTNQVLLTSSAAEYLGNGNLSNPEEILAAAVASCHMLTFFALASKMGHNIESYTCKSTAKLGKNEANKISVTEIDLAPVIQFRGDKIPTSEQVRGMHEKAHKNCFIAQSINSKVNIL